MNKILIQWIFKSRNENQSLLDKKVWEIKISFFFYGGEGSRMDFGTFKNRFRLKVVFSIFRINTFKKAKKMKVLILRPDSNTFKKYNKMKVLLSRVESISFSPFLYGENTGIF